MDNTQTGGMNRSGHLRVGQEVRDTMQPRKVWQANYNGHAIKVIYTWANMLKLKIDEEVKDELNIKLHIGFSEDVFLTSSIPEDNGITALVEVFVKPTFAAVDVR